MGGEKFSNNQISETKREFSQLKSEGDEVIQKTLKSGRKLIWRSHHVAEDEESEQTPQLQNKFSFKMGISQRRIRGWNSKQEQVNEAYTQPQHADLKEKIVSVLNEQLFHAVTNGDSFLTNMLLEDGASLEWINSDGMTPLMLASTLPKLFDMVLSLLKMGANLKAYKSGPHGGYALHLAAVAGLTDTVALLLSYGADSLLANDDGQTPLDIARERKHVAVVRIIEDWICLFGGFLREIYVSETKTTSKRICLQLGCCVANLLDDGKYTREK